MKIEKIESISSTPNAMFRDLGIKFREDHIALIGRNLAVMVEEIGLENAIHIIMSVLAASGLALEGAGLCKPGGFISVVAAAQDLNKKQRRT